MPPAIRVPVPVGNRYYSSPRPEEFGMRLVVRIAFCMLVASPLLAQRNSLYELPIREHVYLNGLRPLVAERPAREYLVSENRTVEMVRSPRQAERETTSGRSR